MFLRAASRGLAPLSTASRASPVSQGVVREARRFLLPTDSAKRMLCKPGTNSVKIGIVGMPNIGKSTLFNCLSAQNVPAQNFPFCTIDPNNAVVEVPDPRMAWLTTAVKPNQTVPATLSITDIAGLVKGASEGKGLGNEFLANIGAVDAILHLVRVFPDSKSRAIEHVEGSVDPIRDLEIISHELLAKDHARVKQANERVQRLAGKAGVDPKRAAQAAAYPKALALIEAGTDVREGLFTEAEAEAISELGLLTAKPILYLMNSAPDAFLTGKVPNAARVREWISKRSPGAPSLIFSADWEADLMLMENAEERASYVADAVADSPRVKEGGDALMQAGEMSYIQRAALDAVPETQSMLPCIITAGYTALDLMQYFTVGDIEVRAWSIKRGTTAPQAAGVIHSDFEKNFICGDIYSYDDIRELGSEAEVKKAGKLKTQGKTYIMQDGDICHWKHAARK